MDGAGAGGSKRCRFSGFTFSSSTEEGGFWGSSSSEESA